MHPDKIRVARRDVASTRSCSASPSPLRNAKANDGPPSLMLCSVILRLKIGSKLCPRYWGGGSGSGRASLEVGLRHHPLATRALPAHAPYVAANPSGQIPL